MRGQKTSADTVYKVIALWSVTDNFSEVARLLEMPVTTVKEIVDKNKDKPEFVKLRKEKQSELAEASSRIMVKALKRLENMIDSPDASIPANHLTTVFGTLFDKHQLMEGKATQNINIKSDEDIEKMAKLAGYKKI